MAPYIHLLKAWPRFQWNEKQISPKLAAVSRRQGRLIGRMEALGLSLRSEAVLATLTEDVVQSSEIEGEVLDREQVRSSLARRLGMDAGGRTPPDRSVEGVVEMMLDATQRYDARLTAERLFEWHTALVPTGRSGTTPIAVGAWRTETSGPVQVVSGPIGRERVHFEAPSFDRIEAEMAAFLDWFNAPPKTDPVLRAAVAHLWFLTVHPFDEGNGRIARAIADMALARSEESPQRFYSLSAQIRSERAAYYDILESTQNGDLNITAWLSWFFDCLDRALVGAEGVWHSVLRKARFWDELSGQSLNERQRTMLNRLLDGFEGKLTSTTWARLTKVSQDTASRDLTDLVARQILVKESGGGRNTSYALVPAPTHRREGPPDGS